MTKKISTSERILRYIVNYTDEHGYAPTLREIASGVNLTSIGTVHRHIETLKKKGILLKTEQASSRAIVVNKQIRSLAESDQPGSKHYICLKTQEGANIIFNCISNHGRISFEGMLYLQGEHEFADSIISCCELDESDYLSLIEGISA